jgi:NTP pyrophosphatase (non-canonical NTP hydrolase)
MNEQLLFITQFSALAQDIHQNARDKGWWDNDDADFLDSAGDWLAGEDVTRIRGIAEKLRNRNEGEMLALIHSEVSEVLEALRHGNPPDDKIPEFSGAEAELADIVIRCMDMAASRGWRLAEAIVAKHAMNKTRAHRHGGKKF